MSDFIEKYKVKPGEFRNFLSYLGNSGLALAITTTFVAPLDRFKIINQTQSILLKKTKFNSFFEYFSEIRSRQGLKGFWRGNKVHVYEIIPRAAIQFTLYENIKKFFYIEGSHLEKILSKLVVAMASSLCTLTICHPIETIRTRLMIEFEGNPKNQTYKNFRNTSKYISNMSGALGVYRGFLLANLMNLPFTLFFLGFYEGLSRMDLPNLYGAVSLSSFLGSCVVYPLDTIKRKMQIIDSKSTIVFANSRECLMSVYKKEGIKGLYSGFGAHAAKFGLAGPINFLVLKTIHSLYYS